MAEFRMVDTGAVTLRCAVEGSGPLAIMVGVGATVASVMLVPVISRIGGTGAPLPQLDAQEA